MFLLVSHCGRVPSAVESMSITRHRLLSAAVIGVMLSVKSNATAQEWIASVKACVAHKDLGCAMSEVETQLTAHPTDFEARAWHARLLAWTGSWDLAQKEYEVVLATHSNDVDLLLGLTDVETWNGKFTDALTVLDKAEQLGVPPEELWLRRARLYMRLGRKADEIAAYKALLRFSPSNREAQSAIDGNRELRHELRIGSDTDRFNYTNAANAESLSLTSRWTQRWSTLMSTTFSQRFGSRADSASVGATYRFSAANWITVTGGGASRQSIAPEEEFDVAYGHGSRLRFGPLRGLESYASTRALWYSTSHVMTIGTTQVLYLPHALMWTVRMAGVRTTFAATGADWVPSGLTRLTLSIKERLSVNGLFAVGAENFSNVDQIGRFSAHTYGGGARVRVNDRQDISSYFAFQKRTGNRTQTSVGVSYGIRF